MIIVAGARLGFLPEDDVTKKPLRIIGQRLVSCDEKRGIRFVIGGIFGLLEDRNQAFLKRQQLRCLLFGNGDGNLHAGPLGQGLHPPAGDLRQFLKCGLCLLVMTGCSLAVVSFDLSQGRLHGVFGCGEQIIHRRDGRCDNVVELRPRGGHFRHESQMELS